MIALAGGGLGSSIRLFARLIFIFNMKLVMENLLLGIKTKVIGYFCYFPKRKTCF